MNKKSYSQILDSVARDHLAANTDLAPRILARIQKGKNTTMQPRMKIAATVFLLLLVLVTWRHRRPAMVAGSIWALVVRRGACAAAGSGTSATTPARKGTSREGRMGTGMRRGRRPPGRVDDLMGVRSET